MYRLTQRFKKYVFCEYYTRPCELGSGVLGSVRIGDDITMWDKARPQPNLILPMNMGF